jgi:hypothetical protein
VEPAGRQQHQPERVGGHDDQPERGHHERAHAAAGDLAQVEVEPDASEAEQERPLREVAEAGDLGLGEQAGRRDRRDGDEAEDELRKRPPDERRPRQPGSTATLPRFDQ